MAADKLVVPSAAHGLRRTVAFWPLVFYGLSDIVGAGIYVAIGQVIARSGTAAPLAFLVAGIAAALTGLCYAELASRFPEAAGAASYLKHVSGSNALAQLAGGVMALTIATAAAAIASGAVQYLAALIHAPAAMLAAGVIVCFTAIAILGVRESVGLAAILGIVELGGLGAVIGWGFFVAPDLDFGDMIPGSLVAWNGVAAGAFIAFFAFLGFETLVNMAEEVKDARRVVPRAVVAAIAISIGLYVLVAVAVTLADRTGSSPLLDLFDGRSASTFAAVSAMAIANGVLVGIVTLSRLFYGMARNGSLPSMIGEVSARTRTPILATVLAGGLVLATAIAVPFEHLLVWTNALTLAVFVAVDLALWHLQRNGGAATPGFRVPRLVPPLAVAISLGLMAAEMLG